MPIIMNADQRSYENITNASDTANQIASETKNGGGVNCDCPNVIDGVDDLTHKYTGANQYLLQLPLTFTFKKAFKKHIEWEGKREWSWE